MKYLSTPLMFFQDNTKKNGPAVYLLLLSILVLRIFYIRNTGLVPDEAYYWDWSRYLSFGYFDHPPMVAWFIYLSTHLLGNTFLGIKITAVLCSFIASIFTYMLSKNYLKKASAFMVLLLLANFTIIFGIGGLVVTPDIPMVMFWAISLFYSYNFFFKNSKWSWIPLGIALGCGMLSKYVFALFLISTILFLLSSKEHRHYIISKRFFGSIIIALLIMLPNIIWNARHDWIAITFQFNHGLGGKAFPSIGLFLEYIAGQIGMLSVLPFVLLIVAFVRFFSFNPNSRKHLFIITFTAIPLIFFALSSLKKHAEPNWPCCAYISGLVMIAMLWESSINLNKKGLKHFILFSVALTCISTIILLIHIKTPIIPLPDNKDPIVLQINGRAAWAHDVNIIREKLDPEKKYPVCTKNYQDAAMLAFYLPDHPMTSSIDPKTRKSQYSMPEMKKMVAGKKTVIVANNPGEDFMACLDSTGNRQTVYLNFSKNIKKQYYVFAAKISKQL
jgi:dolichol-phosphate mannosyltransferase